MTELPEISSTQRFKEVSISNNFQSVSPAAAFGINWDATSALTLGVFGGIAPDGTEKTNTTLTLTGSATNYVEMTTAGVVSSNTSAYTSGRVKIGRFTTNTTGISSYIDDRSFAPGGLSVSGPASATDNAIARWDGATGKFLQNSSVTISDTGVVSFAAGAVGAPSATFGDAASGLYKVGTNEIGMAISGAIVSTWTGVSFVVGHTASIPIGATATMYQGHGTGASAGLSMGRWSNNSNAPAYWGLKSRGASIGTHTAVQDGDGCLRLDGDGSDGTEFQIAARLIIEAEGTVSTGVVPGRFRVLTSSAAGALTEALRIDSSQKILGGLTASLTVGQASKLQIGGTGSINGGISVSRFSADAVGSRIEFSKSRHATMGSNTIAQSGDALGSIIWYGADGTNYDAAAQIIAEVDGTPGSGTDMPGRIRFLTSPDGTATLTEAMRIDNKANVVVSTAALATGATDGFLYVPTCAGTPTGAPTAYTGRAPVIVDTSNNRWYFYSGGAWRNAGP